MFNTNPSRQALSDNQLRVLPLTAGEPKIGDASFRQPFLTAKRKVVVPMDLKTLAPDTTSSVLVRVICSLAGPS